MSSPTRAVSWARNQAFTLPPSGAEPYAEACAVAFDASCESASAMLI
jgi:hypothetical protein